MAFNIGGIPRIPVFTGTDAERLAMTAMITGDLFYTNDTLINYVYTGAAWADMAPAPPVPDVVKIGSVTFAGEATKSFTGLDSTYKSFYLVLRSFSGSTGWGDMGIQINGDTGNVYDVTSVASIGDVVLTTNQSKFILGSVYSNTNYPYAGYVIIPQVKSGNNLCMSAGGNATNSFSLGCFYHSANTDGVTSITILSAQNITGTADLYGFK